MTYDVSIIGAGVIGALIARQLSKYELNICLLESASDIAMGSTKANSAIVHAGYDPLPGSLKALLCVKGNLMFDNLTKELDIPFKRIGSLVFAFNEKDMEKIKVLYRRGLTNGVTGLRILTAEEVRSMEPNASRDVTGALFAPTAGITCPYELTLGAVENAVENGVSLKLETKVHAVGFDSGRFTLATNHGEVASRYVVNAAGLHADAVAEMIGDLRFHITPRKGEYLLLDKSQGRQANSVVFQPPSAVGKGILVTPTVGGNLLIGPNAEDVKEKGDLSTTASGMEGVVRGALKSIPGIDVKQVITSFAGLRAVPSTGDFIIAPAEKIKGFIHAAGIESPGLTAAPAIAEYAASLLNIEGLQLIERRDYKPVRKAIRRFSEASDEEKEKLIAENHLYGRVVCRCESVTEAEIVECIRRPAGARDLDGVKRRTRAGMGRCQAGFCTPGIVRILSREVGVPAQQITKKGGGSLMLAGETKGAAEHERG